jgi:hypothetical protein
VANAISIVVPVVAVIVVTMIMIVVPIPIMAMIAAVVIVPVIVIVSTIVIVPMAVIATFVAWFVFLRADEIHRPIAGMVFMAVLAPVFGMPRWHMQINGRWRGRLSLNDHRLRVHEGRRTRISNSHLAVNARGNFPRQYDV